MRYSGGIAASSRPTAWSGQPSAPGAGTCGGQPSGGRRHRGGGGGCWFVPGQAGVVDTVDRGQAQQWHPLLPLHQPVGEPLAHVLDPADQALALAISVQAQPVQAAGTVRWDLHRLRLRIG
ncbi:hypothetical protein ACIBKY_04710 [Nonomuraea sp. NPDC050394]|uniref:hypothetical protein n=1 Tax=Nonomuraea sp. NPDC050394 TaxID=3364363 RepID=UPI0037883AD7